MDVGLGLIQRLTSLMRAEMVLILVLVDVGLGRLTTLHTAHSLCVLILVLVDVGLGL